MAGPLLGMMTYSFNRTVTDGQIDVPGIVRLCADMGLDSVDVTERHWLDPERDVPATAAVLGDTGLTVGCCNTALDLITRGAQAEAERQQALRGIFGRLAQVGCQIVMLGSTTGDLSPEEWREQFGMGLGESVPIAEEYGITVTFENRGGTAGLFVGTVEHCLEIMQHSGGDRLRFTFDVGNFHYVGKDPNEAFERLADTIAHVHLKDVEPRGDSFGMVPLGKGEVDNAPIIQKLAQRGYTGCLAIECGGRGDDEEDARKSAEFARASLGR